MKVALARHGEASSSLLLRVLRTAQHHEAALQADPHTVELASDSIELAHLNAFPVFDVDLARANTESVVLGSVVGALGCLFWRTTMGPFLCYEPVSCCANLVLAPTEMMQWPN
jgi:hypothetical protein